MSQDVDQVFAKYDTKRDGTLDVHHFVLKLISPGAAPEPWFRDRQTYEFHLPVRAPMKRVHERGTDNRTTVEYLQRVCCAIELASRLSLSMPAHLLSRTIR